MAEQHDSTLSLLARISVEPNDKTGTQILDAALDLFIEFGLRRNTMEDIASRAGLGRATLYRRFGDKDQLIQAVILRECERNLAVIEERIRSRTTALDALLEAFVLAVTMAHRHPLLTRLLSSEPADILPHLTVSLAPVMQFARPYLASQIRQAQAAGGLDPDRPAEQTAEMLLRLLQSLLLSPEGVINPADEESLRAFADSHLRPLLEAGAGSK